MGSDDKNKRPEEDFRDPFLEGNEAIGEAILRYQADTTEENYAVVIDTICRRMREDGHFIVPVEIEEGGESFRFRMIQVNDGTLWPVCFSTEEEFNLGAPSEVLSNFIDTTLASCVEAEAPGFILDPWGNHPFTLPQELIRTIVPAQTEGAEQSKPLKAEDLADGTLLKAKIKAAQENLSQLKLIEILRLLHSSDLWIPCQAKYSDADYAELEKAAKEAEASGDLSSIVGRTFTNKDPIRLKPDILQSGDDFFFPVFTSPEDMGEYGDGMSKLQRSFLEILDMAEQHEMNVVGIVINAFSENFFLPRDLFDLVRDAAPLVE